MVDMNEEQKNRVETRIMQKCHNVKNMFPLVINAQDYHEFNSYQFNFEINDIKVKFEECGYGCPSYFSKYFKKYPGLRGYIAVFWVGKKPIELINKIKEELN